MTHVPNIRFYNTGLIIPDELEILDGVLKDTNDAFNGGLNISNLATPQGQLATSQTAIIGANNDLFAHFVNQVDPTYADGIMQDAIARIYFLDRKPALPTTVDVLCTGLYGTVIPVGAKVKDINKNIYVCTEAGSIPVGGSITLPFENILTGQIPCDTHAITKIYQLIPGWDLVDNVAPGVEGQAVETRADFETRRRLSVAMNGQHSLQSIYGAVFNVPGVIDCYCAENTTNGTVTVGATAYSMNAHSIYVGVVGGAAADIAQAIWTKKSLGADMMGNQTVTVADESGYSSPYPTYSIKYNIPSSLAIKFAISITNEATLPVGVQTLIKQAVINKFIGADGSTRMRIGSTIYASKFCAAIASVSPSVEIISVQVGTSTANANTVAVGIDKVPTIQTSDITVTLV